MSKPSRYVRPDQPIPTVLQPRDIRILEAVHKHRYLTSVHIHHLFFGGKTMNAVRVRLRKLWSNHCLDRYYFPIMLTGIRKSQPEKGRALYSLAKRGAEILVEHLGYDPDDIPCTPRDNTVGFAYLKHHLVVTDMLVALESSDRDDVEVVKTERETSLRQIISSARTTGEFKGQSVISDGFFTLRYPGSNKPWTFHLLRSAGQPDQ